MAGLPLSMSGLQRKEGLRVVVLIRGSCFMGLYWAKSILACTMYKAAVLCSKHMHHSSFRGRPPVSLVEAAGAALQPAHGISGDANGQHAFERFSGGSCTRVSRADVGSPLAQHSPTIF